MPRKKKLQVVISIPAGEQAVCGDPNRCLFAKKFKEQGFKSPKVTMNDIRISVPADHPRVAEFGHGQWRIPTPNEVVYYIGQFDSLDGSCQLKVMPVGIDVVLDFTQSGAKFFPARDREDEKAAYRGPTGIDATCPKRQAQLKSAAYNFAVRNANARLRRAGQPVLTASQAEVSFGHLNNS